jgi:PUA domain protein
MKQLSTNLAKRFGKAASDALKGAIELVELEDGREVILINGKPSLLKTSDGVFPTLMSIDRIQPKRVTVDMGAVPYVAGGADIMAPGVVTADEDIVPGDCVIVVDERHGKQLAIGLALVASPLMKASKGKVVKNLHFVGDKIWQLSSTRKD